MGSSSMIGAALGALAIGTGAMVLLGGSKDDTAKADEAMQQARQAMINFVKPKRQAFAQSLERELAVLGPCHEFSPSVDYKCQRPTYQPDFDEKILFIRSDEPLRRRYFHLAPWNGQSYSLRPNALDSAFVSLSVTHPNYTFEYDGTRDRLSVFSNEDATRRPVDEAFFRNMILDYEIVMSFDSSVHSFLSIETFPAPMQRVATQVLATAGNNIDLVRCRRQEERRQLEAAAGMWKTMCYHSKSYHGADTLWLRVGTRGYSANSAIPLLN